MKDLNREEIRENLVRNLSDIETIKRYLHPQKYNIYQLLKEALKPFKNNTILKLQYFIYCISAGLIPVIDLYIIYFLIDIISKSDVSNQNIITIVGTLLSFYLLLSVISTQIGNRTRTIFTKTRLDFLHKCAEKYMSMDFGLFENPDFLNEANRFFEGFTSNEEGLEGVYHKLFELGSNLVSFLMLAIILWLLSPIILIISFFCLITYLLIKDKIAKYKYDRLEKLNLFHRKSKTLSDICMDFKYGKDIRLYDFNKKLKDKMDDTINSSMSFYKDITRPEVKYSFILALSILLVELISYYQMGERIFNKKMELSEISLYISSILLFISKLELIGRHIAFIREEIKYFADGIDFMNANLSSISGDKSLNEQDDLEIEFKNVSFSYPKDNKKIFENLSFKINKKEKIAIVGVNGAGKTTLVKLILGLYKPISGKILINGIDSEQLDISERFNAFSVVLQETDPLSISIAENVTGKVSDIDKNRVYEVLEKIGLKEKINSLHKGIDTQMTKIIDETGILFSGGENQKLAIARALYKKEFKALILDEPTASLDALAEEKLYRKLDQITENKTLIFISHRLASTSFCDKIMLMDGGEIVEYGSHDRLMKNDGLYKKMFLTQAKYYKE